jgi:nicotinamide mononucleotide transporter
MPDAPILPFGLPQEFWDYSGAVFVVISLVYLFRKHIAYWHWSNLSNVPFFVLFMARGEWQFAGLQVAYLIFGVHGLYLWFLEHRRDRGEIRFNEPLWYAVTWVASLVIFAYTISVTNFADPWNWVQFASVALALIANFGTTRKWSWSWPVWIVVNAVTAVYWFHFQVWGQFALQFILAGMSVYGWLEWRKQDAQGLVARAA